MASWPQKGFKKGKISISYFSFYFGEVHTYLLPNMHALLLCRQIWNFPKIIKSNGFQLTPPYPVSACPQVPVMLQVFLL